MLTLRRRSLDLTPLGVFAIYLAISVVYVGWRLAPHPGRLLIGCATRDPEIFIWSFAWWPHAIAHWINPFSTHLIYAPTGINLTWATTSPALALAFSPLTLLFGPAVSYNVAAVLLPALAAWAAFALCRELTRSFWASLVGGYLFGFSSALLQSELWGQLNMAAVFILPLIALVLVRYLRKTLTERGLTWRLGVLLAGQLLISTEVAFTATLVLAIGLLVAYWVIAEARPRLRSAFRPVAEGYVLGGLLTAPFVVYMLLGIPSAPLPRSVIVGSDLLNFVLPTSDVAIGGSTLNSVSNRFPEGSAYLGLPTLLIVGAFALGGWRSRVPRFLVALFLICSLIAVGTTLHVDGKKSIPLPWHVVASLPGFENVIPFRFTVYVSLIAAVIVALWTAKSKGRIYARPFLLPVLAVAALVPAVWQSSFRAPAFWQPDRPTFFTAGLYKKCIPRNETVAIFPFGANGDSLLWQAEANFWFRLAGDNLGPVTVGKNAWTRFDSDWVVEQLYASSDGRPTMASLLAFTANHHVDRILSVQGGGYPTATQMRSFGRTQLVGGVFIAPACGQPSLAKRNLTSYVRKYEQQRQSSGSIEYCLGSSLESLAEGLTPSGPLQGAKPALFVVGRGLTCSRPSGYKRAGFATPGMGVPAHTYPFYRP